MIELADVSLSAGKFQLFDRFSLTLPDPGIYVLSGPNGSGKSLVCRLIGGRLKPGGGQVRIDGSPPRGNLAALSSDFYSEAGRVDTCNETIREYLAAELSAAGITLRNATDYLGLLDSYFADGVATPLTRLSSGELLILQFMLAAAAPGRTAILDGHLDRLSEDTAVYCLQILLSSLVEHEKFIILTAHATSPYIEGESTAVRLAGGLPVRIAE